MLRLGAPANETREMDLDDIFAARLRLLILMAKAYIEGCPLGDYRRQAMLENANHIESESIDLGSLPATAPPDGSPNDTPIDGSIETDHVFYQRVKLLAVMIKAVAKGFPMGEHRKNAMRENIELICARLLYRSSLEEISWLKVA